MEHLRTGDRGSLRFPGQPPHASRFPNVTDIVICFPQFNVAGSNAVKRCQIEYLLNAGLHRVTNVTRHFPIHAIWRMKLVHLLLACSCTGDVLLSARSGFNDQMYINPLQHGDRLVSERHFTSAGKKITERKPTHWQSLYSPDTLNPD